MLPTTLPYLSKLTGPRQVGILSLARSAASNAFLSSILPSTLERRFEHGAVGIGRGGVEAGIDLVVAVHTFDEFLFSGLSSCAEYQHVEMMPMASSPICCSNASSIAVMPPRIGVLPPYSLYCLKNLKPLEPAKPMKTTSMSCLSCAM